MPISVPVAVVQKSGIESAILTAELARVGYRKGIDFTIVEYPEALTLADDKLKFVFLGMQWGSRADFSTLEQVRDKGARPVFVASFDEHVVAEGGPCNLRVARGPGNERYHWLLALLNMELRRAS